MKFYVNYLYKYAEDEGKEKEFYYHIVFGLTNNVINGKKIKLRK